MNFQKIIFAITIACFTLTSCKSEKKETTKTEITTLNKQNVNLKISGMTCEIGCAKTIASKLSKKEGVLEAKVIFKDSIANIQYDANKLTEKDLVAFVDSIAGGDLYKATVCAKKSCNTADKKNCETDCKKACCTSTDKKSCDTAAKTACKTAATKTCCKEAAKKSCDTAAKTACKADCKKECCTAKK